MRALIAVLYCSLTSLHQLPKSPILDHKMLNPVVALRERLLNSNKTVCNISSNTLDRRTIRFKKVFNVNNSLGSWLGSGVKLG